MPAQHETDRELDLLGGELSRAYPGDGRKARHDWAKLYGCEHCQELHAAIRRYVAALDAENNAVDGDWQATDDALTALKQAAGINNTPAPAPLEEAIAACYRLTLNPLCAPDHALRLLREDAAVIVQRLADQLAATSQEVN